MANRVMINDATIELLELIRNHNRMGTHTPYAEIVRWVVMEYANKVTPVDAASKPEVDKYAELFAGLKTQADVDALPPAAHREWWRRAKLELDANDAKVRQAWIDGGGR